MLFPLAGVSLSLLHAPGAQAGLRLEHGKEEGDDAASIDSLEKGKAEDVNRGADGGDWSAGDQENMDPNLPSTLFFGVRGEQASCSANSGPTVICSCRLP